MSDFILSGSSHAAHIPVVQYLPYGSTANFRALTDLLLKQEEQWNGNSASDLCGIKIKKIG